MDPAGPTPRWSSGAMADHHQSGQVDEYAIGAVEIPDDPVDVATCASHCATGDPYQGEAPKVKFSWRKLWAFTGPGWLMSIAYLDPGNLTSDLQQGAYTNYKILWVLFWATVIGWVLQSLSARLCVVTGMDLAQICRKEFPKKVSIMLFVQIQIAIVGADIQEVLGSAVAFKILTGISLPWGCVVTAGTTFSFLFVLRYGVRWLEAFFVAFIAVMCVAFFICWGKSDTDGTEFVKGWALPTIQSYALMQAIGTLGAVIMPHNLYLHSGLVKSRAIDRNNPCKLAEGNYYNTMEGGMALLVSYFINAAVVVTFASSFFSSKCANVSGGPYGCVSQAAIDKQSSHIDRYGDCTLPAGEGGQCVEIGLELAADALHHALGGSAKWIWGIGLLAAGQAATMTTTYAGQFAMSGFFDIDMPAWAVVCITRVIAIGPATAIAMIAGSNASVSADMNEWLNTLQSLQLPFALIPVLHFTNSARVMGVFANGFKSKVCYWFTGFALIGINLYFVIDFAYFDDGSPLPKNWFCGILVGLYLVAYLFCVAAVLQDEIKAVWSKITGKPLIKDALLSSTGEDSNPVSQRPSRASSGPGEPLDL